MSDASLPANVEMRHGKSRKLAAHSWLFRQQKPAGRFCPQVWISVQEVDIKPGKRAHNGWSNRIAGGGRGRGLRGLGGLEDRRSCIGSRWTALIEPRYVDSNAFQCVAKQPADPITYCHPFPASRLSLGSRATAARKRKPRNPKTQLDNHPPIQNLTRVSCSTSKTGSKGQK